MMIIAMMALSAAFQQTPRPAQQQPARPAQRPAQAAPSTRQTPANIQPTHTNQPVTPYDTTVAALSDIGTKVAEMRSTYELYRRAVYNEPNGAIVDRAGLYRTSCQALSAATVQGERRICRNCLPRNVQPAIDQYRVYLPQLKRLADACAARVVQLKARGGEGVVAAALKADVRPEGDRMANGLRLYEVRLREVRRVMGWDQQPVMPTPRRGS